MPLTGLSGEKKSVKYEYNENLVDGVYRGIERFRFIQHSPTDEPPHDQRSSSRYPPVGRMRVTDYK